MSELMCSQAKCRRKDEHIAELVEQKELAKHHQSRRLQADAERSGMRKELAALRELLTLIRDDLRMRSEDGVVDISDFIWMRIDKVLQEKGE